MPSSDYTFIYDKVLAYSTTYIVNNSGETLMDCSDKNTMRNINLLINGQWVSIATADYLTPVRTLQGQNKEMRPTGYCSMCLKLSPDNDWRVGTSLLVGYYSSFDFTNRQLSLHALKNSGKGQIVAGGQPSIVLGNSWWKITILALLNAFTIAVLVLLCLAVYFETNVLGDDTKEKKEAEPEVPDEA